MRFEDHVSAFKEHKRSIFEWALRVLGLEHSQRTVGLHASRGIVELLSAYLHRTERITAGAQLNHRWFKSRNVLERLPVFPEREAIVELLVELENLSEGLTYGAPHKREEIEHALELFSRTESMIRKLDGGWIDEQE